MTARDGNANANAYALLMQRSRPVQGVLPLPLPFALPCLALRATLDLFSPSFDF